MQAKKAKRVQRSSLSEVGCVWLWTICLVHYLASGEHGRSQKKARGCPDVSLQTQARFCLRGRRKRSDRCLCIDLTLWAPCRQSSGGLRYKNLPRSSKLLGIPHEFILHKCFASVFVFSNSVSLMGSSAQISSGVCRRGSEEQVPEEGSRRFRRVPVCASVGSGGRFRRLPVCAGVGAGGRFRRVPACAGVGSGGRFRRVPVCAGVGFGGVEWSGVCWCRFRFRRVPVCAGVGFGGRFRRVPVCAGVGSGGRFRRVPVSAGVGFGGRFRRDPVCAGVGSGGRLSESSGVCWLLVPEAGCRRVPVCAGVGSGGRFWRDPACAGVGSGGRFRRVPVCAGVGFGGRFRRDPVRRFWRQVPERSGVCWCRFWRQVPERSGVCWCRFRRQLLEGSGGSSVSEGSGEFRCRLLACNLDRSSYVIVFEPLLVMTLSTWAKPLRNKNAPM